MTPTELAIPRSERFGTKASVASFVLGIHPTRASMAALPLLLLGIVEWAEQPNLKRGPGK